jgi:hypothetical protein
MTMYYIDLIEDMLTLSVVCLLLLYKKISLQANT